MNVFNNYARYYDLLYKDKDYGAEATYIHTLIQQHAPNANSILELGCGTGVHATLLAERGYTLHGVDMSAEMLETAKARLLNRPRDLSEYVSFSQGDIRTIRIKKKFDTVVSLFHVMSYQTTNEGLLASFATAKHHLKPGGIFIFDCWYGPAVLSEKPAVRVKRLEDEQVVVTRIAEPVMHVTKNIVDVNYHVFIKNKSTGTVEELHEVHSMRYLFSPEIDILLPQLQLKLLASFEWMSGREPGVDTWGVCFVVQA
jgi:SAM-dependent methyltransferase